MKRLIVALALILLPSLAHAASCSSYPFTLQNNTTADATQVMSNFNTARNCVINNAAALGANADITSLSALTTPLTPAQGGTAVFIGGTATGSANAQAVTTTTPTTFALTAGYRLTYVATATNTGATTLDVLSAGATAVRKPTPAGPLALTGGEIVSGNVIEVIYDGTYFILLTINAADFNTLTTLAGGPTTDLGTIPSHNISITGASTITAFGSTAVASSPVYFIKFTGTNTLTYNATSLIIPGAANITTSANDAAVVEYLGSGNWQVLSYTRASGASIIATSPLPGALGLAIANNAGTPNTNVDLTAGTVVMVNTSGVSLTASTVSVTINATTTGANGLDAGALGTSTWYYVWVISNGSATAGLMSLSATAPTMPSGYTFKVLLGAMQTDGSSNFYRMQQKGNLGSYKITAATNTLVMRAVATGTAGTYSTSSPTLTAATVRGNGFCAPSTATAANIVGYYNWKGAGVSNVLVAPSTAWGGANNGPAGSAGQIWPIYVFSPTPPVTALITLEADTIAWASDGAGGALGCMSWVLPVNAN